MAEITLMPNDTRTANYGDGAPQSIQPVDAQGALLVSQRHGSMLETTKRKGMFHAASQAATTTTVALATTYTGLCLSNPVGSGVILVPTLVSAALSVAPAGIAPMAIGGGYLAAGVTTHTTPLTIYNSYLGNATASAAKADAACTLPTGPRVLMPFLGGFTAGALFGTSPSILKLNGEIVIPEGGYVFIYTLTVAVGLFGIFWEEIQV